MEVKNYYNYGNLFREAFKFLVEEIWENLKHLLLMQLLSVANRKQNS